MGEELEKIRCTFAVYFFEDEPAGRKLETNTLHTVLGALVSGHWKKNIIKLKKRNTFWMLKEVDKMKENRRFNQKFSVWARVLFDPSLEPTNCGVVTADKVASKHPAFLPRRQMSFESFRILQVCISLPIYVMCVWWTYVKLCINTYFTNLHISTYRHVW